MAPARARTAVNGDAESIRAAIAGGTSTERTKALQELIYFFTKKLQGSTQLSLDARAYHNLLEALFQCALVERKSFLANRRSTKNTAEARLVATAEALRLAVNYGAVGIKRKVARAIVDHITQTLPGRDGEYVEPLLQDYTKALVALLSHPANVEQLAALDGDGWLACADLFVNAVTHFAASLDVDFSLLVLGGNASPHGSRGASPAPSVFPQSGSGGPSRKSASQSSSKILETLIQGIYCLVSATNAPLKKRATELAQAALSVLRMRQLGVGTLQQTACASIRCIVQRIRGDDVTLVEGIVRELAPLLGHWWHPRSSANQSESVNSTREEILRTVYTIQLHIEALALHSPTSGILGHVKDLLDALGMEYAKRDDRTRMQLNDITFSYPSSSCFDTGTFSLCSHDVSAERRWAVVDVISLLEATYARHHTEEDTETRADEDEDGEQPRKRRRIGTPPSRLLDQIDAPDVSVRITALQVLPFYLQKHETTLEEMAKFLARLGFFITDKQAVVCSWAMIACASCTLHKDAKDQTLASLWTQIWQVAVRSVSLPGASRAACVLLHAILEKELLSTHAIGDDINNLVTAAEVSGPALLADSSLSLMLHLLHLRNALVPSASQATSAHIIKWLFSRWKPADAGFASLYAAQVPSFDLLLVLNACMGVPMREFERPVDPFGGPIRLTWHDHAAAEDMMRYLLLLPASSHGHSTPARAPCKHFTARGGVSSPFADQGSSNLSKKLVLELLLPVVDAFVQLAESWSRKGGENIAHVTQQRMRSLVTFCIVCANATPQLTAVSTSLSQDLEPTLLNIADMTLAALSDAEQNKTLLEAWLATVASHLPQLSAADIDCFCKEDPVLLKVIARLSRAVDEANVKQSSLANAGFMELDDEFDSAVSQGSVTSKEAALPRHRAGLTTSAASYYLNIAQRLHLLSLIQENGTTSGVLPETFVDRFLALSNEDILMCSVFMKQLFASDLVVLPDDALKVVEVIGGIIGQLEYSCCEMALTTCIDVIQGFVCVWPDEKLDVSARIGDLYTHLVQQLLPKNSLSTSAQICLSRLLYQLMQVKSSYGGELGLPSCRSILLSLLQTSDMAVRYAVGMDLHNIFALYVLKVHDDLFVDVLDSLPSDPTWHEGIAFRLLVLSELASSWPTLLRRCLYHIFETPGRLKQCAKFASRCLTNVARALSLESPRELFKLFTPQLLYTWLERDKIEDIPYEIFGFGSLNSLIDQAQTEATALMVMRGQEAEAFGIAQSLGMEPASLFQQTFAKTFAYSVAHDVAMVKDNGQATSESRLRRVLGKQQLIDAIHLNLADIVAILLDLIDQEDPIEKYLSRDPSLQYAADIMAEIKAHYHSSVTLPPNQQPMFRAKYLTRELAHICSRIEHSLETLWTPALVVSVARRLFNTVRPAFGSLHACSVLRKVRILICLAGEQATGSYPLEMLLHAVRPFTQDAECADDALGITKYLLIRGAGHLARVPSFYAGYALTMLTSLRMFLESSQASTTQESQFKATMGKAQQFHVWFSQHLRSYDSTTFKSEAQRAAFRSITRSATQIRASGNAEKGTPESALLLDILKDGEQTDRLLNDSARDLVLGMLCSDFHVPTSGQADIIATDEEAVGHGAVVWKSCGAQALSDEYLVWAGRVVGRSFAASGAIHADLLRESRLDQGHHQATSSSIRSSEEGLLRLLETLTMDRDSVTAGLAESALRTIVTQAVNEGDTNLQLACQASLSEPLLFSSSWGSYRTPPSDFDDVKWKNDHAGGDLFQPSSIEKASWAQDVAAYLAGCIRDDVVLCVLPPILANAKGFAEKAFPFLLHLVLLLQLDKQQTVKRQFSAAAKAWLANTALSAQTNAKLLLNAMIYLRAQPLPNEASIVDRHKWLDMDLPVAAAAASRCGMYRTALQFAETAVTTAAKTSRRSSGPAPGPKSLEAFGNTALLLDIYENIDDPDAYYGVPQSPSLASVLARLEYEKDGSKALAFRGAQYDSHIRRHDAHAVQDGQALALALSNIGLSGLSHSLLLQTQQSVDGTQASPDSTYTTARRLGMWNLPVPAATDNPAVTVYRAFQGVHQATTLAAAQKAIYEGIGNAMKHATGHNLTVSSLRQHLGSLAALTELDDVLTVQDESELQRVLDKFEARSKWMMSKQYDDVSPLLSYRETTLRTMSEQGPLRSCMRVSAGEARLVEIKGLLLSSSIYRFHHAMQESLNVTTSLADLIQPSEEDMGLRVDAAIQMETASSLWDHGEMVASIRVLQGIDRGASLEKQMVPVSRPDLLSQIGHQVSVARLESADAIRKKYLEPALKELAGRTEGKEAGRVFHQFAMFCDEQLQSADSLEDLARLKTLREGKSNEVKQLQRLMDSARDAAARHQYTSHLNKARQWLDLDDQELRRVEQMRSDFVATSLENYLLSLIASDEHNNDSLRFTALWLERSGEASVNAVVKRHLGKVATRKFVPLMNQLTSRLQDQSSSAFQHQLIHLVFRICCDHPFHGMYHVWSVTRSRPHARDTVAVLRSKATERVAKELARTAAVAAVWQAVDKTSRCYHALAVERDEHYRAGQRLALKDSAAGQALMQALARCAIPPPTMAVPVAADKVYAGRVATMVRLEPTMTIANGVSAPKILTVVGSDGRRYKQLVKGGHDDLRQDAIMEQVFAAVSALLKRHRLSRQRSLGIRTYKVLPLTATSGLIEFVPHTTALHDYLMPAHERYHPRDWKGAQCRKEIDGVQGRPVDTRVATFRRVTERFQPALRFFFLEFFPDPDAWFARRLAYTRTTAAISMLGHVLGVGDRHGHNILLDTKTGEVVHIDLGVAFEMGRVLPVPELVPFRLTRDIVDGMGITGTEGVFRRCCEFTLDAMRAETYSIMTILDVLRYDPLYSWSISPVRLAKLQDARVRTTGEAAAGTAAAAAAAAAATAATEAGVERAVVNEPSEADRALEVVRKKLSKTLSVEATVNDLINQATDERNLAVLYSGWGAYA